MVDCQGELPRRITKVDWFGELGGGSVQVTYPLNYAGALMR